MSFRRIRKEIDPRRPPKRNADDEAESPSKARAYGQYVDLSSERVEELEDVTGEVAREGGPESGEDGGGSRSGRRNVEAREAFEDATDEVSREDEEPDSTT